MTFRRHSNACLAAVAIAALVTAWCGPANAQQKKAVPVKADAIGRIERHDAKINAVCVRDFARGMEAARAADSALARGETKPLLGLPMTVKEQFNVAGLPTTWGDPKFKDWRPDADVRIIELSH